MLAAIMKKSDTQQRRATRRFSLPNPIHLSGRTLPLVVGPTRASRGVSGSVRNISSSGLCLLGQKRLKISELLVELELPFPERGQVFPLFSRCAGCARIRLDHAIWRGCSSCFREVLAKPCKRPPESPTSGQRARLSGARHPGNWLRSLLSAKTYANNPRKSAFTAAFRTLRLGIPFYLNPA